MALGTGRRTIEALFGGRSTSTSEASPSTSGGGSPLPSPVQAKMEAALGADFSAVRIHQGAQADALGAEAYTQGTDIHFAPGRYDPHNARGQELLGHELVHVIQQASGRVGAPGQAKGVSINSDPGLEREADELGARAARGDATARASSTSRSASPAPAPRVIQRMTLLPFAQADQVLTTFVGQHAAGMAGDLVQGTPTSPIGIHEKLVIVGHGNGLELYSHADAKHQSLSKLNYAELADYLAKSVLPPGYRGEIVVWSCSSATPWKHVPAIAKDLNRGDPLLDTSFIKQLEAVLRDQHRALQFAPKITGSIGFVSMDRNWDDARVYAGEDDPVFSTTYDAKRGFISTQDRAPEKFYKKSDEPQEETVDTGHATPVHSAEPTRRSTRLRERATQPNAVPSNVMEVEPQQNLPQQLPFQDRAEQPEGAAEQPEGAAEQPEDPAEQLFQDPAPQQQLLFQDPAPQQQRQPVERQIGYLVRGRTPGSLQDRLARNHFGGDEQKFHRWKKKANAKSQPYSKRQYPKHQYTKQGQTSNRRPYWK